MIHVAVVRRRKLDLMLFRGGDARVARHLGRTPTAPDARRLRRCRRGGSCGGRGGRGGPSTTTCGRCRLLLGADALFPLPARTNARHLIVGEQSEMAAHRDIHLAKQRDHVVAGYPELACHVVYAKLAQTVLLAGSNRVRSMPPRRGRLDECTNASRELWIDDADCGRRFPSKRGAQLGRRRTF